MFLSILICRDRPKSAAVGNTSRYSLGSLYPRSRALPVSAHAPSSGGGGDGGQTSLRSTTSSNGGGALSSDAEEDAEDNRDLLGVDLINRHSVAIFERLNKEQVRELCPSTIEQDRHTH